MLVPLGQLISTRGQIIWEYIQERTLPRHLDLAMCGLWTSYMRWVLRGSDGRQCFDECLVSGRRSGLVNMAQAAPEI